MDRIKKFILKSFIIYEFYEICMIKRFSLPFFKTVNTTTTGLAIHFNTNTNCPNPNKGLHYITYIPPYVETIENDDLEYKSLYQYQGFLADIKNYESLDAYMQQQFGIKSRRKIRSYCNRLDSCFNTSYKVYYGSIEKTNYLFIMNELDHLIKRRFDQRGDVHQAKKDWEYYAETTYQNILDKKASIFVIYDNDKPIYICLNFHYVNIMVNFIRAFDIDYAKFRLGYIDIFKHLEWCFKNNYQIFDLGAGVFSYKEQWCNVAYKFKNTLVFNKTSINNRFLASFTFSLLKLKLYLSKKNIIKDKANANFDSSNNNANNHLENTQIKFQETEVNNFDTTKDFIKIDIEQNDYKFLRKTIYEYLYLNFENKNSITIYKLNNQSNSYYIAGKKNCLLTPIVSD